ncbi:MAG: response regulator [bacterium]|nr:response regulator [bacterium]
MEVKVLYLIKWIKNEKPFYQLGEIIPSGNNKYLPTPPEIFYNLNISLQFIKNKHGSNTITLLSMGFNEEELNEMDRFIKFNKFISSFKHLAKPIGKKSDGTPYKIFMIDSDFDSLKKIKQIMVSEHFEIIGIARTGKDALRFLKDNYKYIDIITTEIILPDEDGYNVIEQIKQISANLRIIIITSSNKELDVKRAIDLKINGYIIKPVMREKIIDNIRKIL